MFKLIYTYVQRGCVAVCRQPRRLHPSRALLHLDEDDLRRLAAGGVQLKVGIQQPAHAAADLVAFNVVVVLSLWVGSRAAGQQRAG